MNDLPRCPKCDSPLPADAPVGLCPKCLVLAGFESQPMPPREPEPTLRSPVPSGFEPPSVEELAGRFPQLEILELLGKGGMGAVYKARQRGLDRVVAVKILPPEIGHDEAFTERFTREARALARLSHNHIVSVYDFGQADGLFFIVMEFVDGINLRQTIQSGGLSPVDALAIVPQICEALQFAHDEGIVHRDIKPENILIDKRGRVKIADFGLAKLMASGGRESPGASLTGAHQVMGTLRYMAPEQMQGSREVDHRADIFSLGVVFYELLTGELPMGRFAPPSKRVQIDVRLDEVVLRALEQDPEQRYQHASDLKTDVDAVSRSPQPAGVARPESAKGVAMPARPGLTPFADSGHATPPRLSRCALAGAIWAGLGMMALILAALWMTPVASFESDGPTVSSSTIGPERAATSADIGSGGPTLTTNFDPPAEINNPSERVASGRSTAPPVFFLGFMILILAVALAASSVFGTTILGAVAIGHIKHSGGKLYGLPLAVADALFFPLLVLSGLIAALVARVGYSMASHPNAAAVTSAGAFGVLVALVICFFVSRAVWRAVVRHDKPVDQPSPASPGERSGEPGGVSPRTDDEQVRGLTPMTHQPQGAGPRLQQEPDASAYRLMGQRPKLVPVLATFNLVGAIMLMLVCAMESPPAFTRNVARVWQLWETVDSVLGFAMAAGMFAASIGLFLWKPWARKVTMGVCIFGLASFVFDAPYLARFLLPDIYAEIQQTMTDEGVAPDPQDFATLATVACLVGGMMIFILTCLIGQLVYFTRPRVVAAFESQGERHGRFVEWLFTGAGAVVGVLSVFGPLALLLGITALVNWGDGGSTVDPATDRADEARIQGTWNYFARIHDGQITDWEELQRWQVTFSQGEYTEHPDDRFEKGTYKLDPTKTPKTIDCLLSDGPNKGLVVAGIYELDGDTLKICWSRRGSLQHSNEFDSAPGSERALVVLKREQPSRTMEPSSQPPGPVGPVKFKAFDPVKDKPVTDGLSVEDGAWRIENTSDNRVVYVTLFDVRAGIPIDGEIVYRATINAKKNAAVAWTFLSLGTDTESMPREYADVADWKTLEVRYPAYIFHQSDPPQIPVKLGIGGAATVWIKDIELWHHPASPPPPPERRPGETVVKSFTYKDKPIHSDCVNELQDGWRYTAAELRSIRLFELRDPDVENCRLVFRARLKTAQATGAYLRMTARMPDGSDLDTEAKRAAIAEGDTDWASYEVSLSFPAGSPPSVVCLLLQVSGRKANEKESRNQVWIKDVELLKALE